MKILITGSAGLVGEQAVRFFTEKGWRVVGIDNNMRSYFFGVKKSPGQLSIDIRDEKRIDQLFRDHRFDAIIHTAAQPSHDWAKKEPLTDFDINARGTLILLEATRKYCPKATFVYVSTDKVYGENMVGEKLSKETLGLDFAGKRSLFGCSKTAADIYVQEYRNYFGMTTVCFRPGCITGKNHKGAEEHGFLSYLAKCIKEGKTYKIFGDGKQVRDQIHVYDLVNAFWHYIENPKGDVYNIGGGIERTVSILEASNLILEELRYTGTLTQEFYEPRIGDRYYDVHDVSKFRADYPEWDYTYSLSDIISDVCGK
jgi:CDP-paratose 2-epimerase